MTQCRPIAALALAASLTACSSGTTLEFLDFSGTWTLDLLFATPNQVACAITGITATVVQTGPTFSGSTTGGTENCTFGLETWPSDQIGDLTISLGVAGPAGSELEDALAFTVSAEGVALTFVGGAAPQNVGFAGALTGTVTLDPFDVGSTEVTGTWTARR